MQTSPHTDALDLSSDLRSSDAVQPPPRGFANTVRQLGPGLIIAGSIVGSGELIATTKAGAQAGISLLWLIILGCVIKVFAQIELGRYSITHGQTTLVALNTLPGPRLRVSWILWYWLLMMLCTLGQLGGIVGGVGQALAISFPITGDYREAILAPSHAELAQHLQWESAILEESAAFKELTEAEQLLVQSGVDAMRTRLADLGEKGQIALEAVRSGETLQDPWTVDDRYWAAAAAFVTVALLYNGRYGPIQNISTALVVSFTFITLGNVYALQTSPEWSLPVEEWMRGLTPHFPDSAKGLATALATFGIIGVGAAELIFYPYWCMEKGYASFVGPHSDDEAWENRARGWMRVMHIDAFASMVVYTVATVAFFVMGVAVLHRMGLDPD
ncbi:MAG: transmembrane Mn(2+) transporter, partial [Planctomycetaceae bacterium]|nr:transmembrane Mn(2+) transporter [Planctomycetaceae bacterium]